MLCSKNDHVIIEVTWNLHTNVYYIYYCHPKFLKNINRVYK